jgi:hypothetical protein
MFEEVRDEEMSSEKRPLTELNEEPSKKRKFDEDTDLKPEDGFTWIDPDTIKAKKVKLDQETIVKKRIEYFKSLGMAVPESTVPVPIHRVKLRTEAGESKRVELVSKSKSGTFTPLRKRLDDDELDELTMKRLTCMEYLCSGKERISKDSYRVTIRSTCKERGRTSEGD